ncbi:MAG: DMT family transporter [Acetobacteraceae bacterium]|nr:DMT family transporter [Acetobacteraceae bacterium]
MWVGFHLVSRFSTAQAMTSWDVAALRFAGAFLTVLPIVLWRGPPRIAPGRALAVLVFAGFGFPLGAFAGYQLAPAAHGATVMAAGLPVGTALLGLALGLARMDGRRALSLCVVAAGSVLLAAATGEAWEGAWKGDLLFLGAVLSWSVYTVLVQRWRLPALDSMLAIGLAAAPAYLPVWWFALPSTIGQAAPAAVAFQAAFQGAFAAVLAGLLDTKAVTLIGPGPTTMIGAAVPALSALAAWPLLGEALPPLGFLAVLLVSAGMALGVVGGRVDPSAPRT